MSNVKSYFDPVNPNINFPEEEKKLLDKWEKKGIVKKYLQKNNSSEKTFSFLDGPITANNPMGVHHAWGRTYKDLWQRYKNMKGFKQRFQNGFDCQGLWVEVEVEKELGINSKKDIENIIPGDKKASIEKFVQLCKDRVKKYSDIQTEQSKRLAYFMDWENSYFTLSENNNYMIWRFLKVCFENGWIYKGMDVVPWCPRCETAISQHEILTEDYKEVTHESVYFRLPIKGRNEEYLLVWTTTPWTIPANTAVAVDPGFDYDLVKQDNFSYWVCKELTKSIFGENPKILKTVKGKLLVGLSYESPFDGLPCYSKFSKSEKEKFHRVIATDSKIMPITTIEGTGLVHTSTSTGEEDHKLGVKLGLPVIPAIDDSANYLEDFGNLSGKNAKKDPSIIIGILKDKGYLFKTQNYTHRYPACWRCKAELVWKVTKEWYVAMDKGSAESKETLRQKMIAVANKIKWIPEFGLDREIDWLNNMHDWLISKKNRLWGLALPIWECECGNFDVVGSYDELKEKAISGWENFEGKTPHKPQIDEISILCSKCKGKMKRIEPVGNPWLDAGIVAFSTISKNNKATLFSGSSEDPLYLENRSEWEKWYPAEFITESFPGQFKNWFYSLIAMSTVLENSNPFRNVLGFATLFAEDGKPMHKSAGNMIEFSEGAEKIGVDVMRWIYCKQNPADNLLLGYKIGDDVRRSFHLKLWNVFNFFVTYANASNWEPKNLKFNSDNVIDKWIISRFASTLKLVERHLDKYNAHMSANIIEEFVDDLSLWYIRRSRNRVGVLAESDNDRDNFYTTCYIILTSLSKIIAPFLPFISDMIYTHLTKEESVHLTDWPLLDELLINKDLEVQMKLIRDIASLAHAQRKENNIAVRQPLSSIDVISQDKKPDDNLIKILLDEINIKKCNWVNGKTFSIVLDMKMTKDLEEEAKTRDLIRKIQALRKELRVELNQSISVTSDWFPENPTLNEYWIKKTLTSKTIKGDSLKIEALN